MNKHEQFDHISRFTARMVELISSKGDDYANEDRLSNFKLVAQMTGTTPELACFNLICVKVARLKELISGKVPKNESLADTLLDLANYTMLLSQILQDTGYAVQEDPL